MRSRRTMWLVTLVVVTLVVVFYLHRRHDREKEAAKSEVPVVPSVAVATARMGSIADQLTVAGIFQPYQEIDVHGKVSGYIRRIYVDIGDRVRQGQTIAVLEVPELKAEVAGAQAGITQSKENINRLAQEVGRAQANFAAVHANYVRLKAASDQQPGLVAAQELDNALAQDRNAAAQIDAAKAAVAAGQGELGVSRANDLRVSSMEQYSVITAPYTGVVTMRYADTGALIPAGTAEGVGQAVVRLAQSDVLRLRMPVPEQDVPMVHAGSSVTVRVQATGQNFPGTVVRYTRDVSNATRTMLTEVDVKNPSLSLTPGMYADVTFNLQQKNDTLLIPAAAVIQGDQPSVLLIDATSHVVRRKVVLGIASANEQEITAGLQPGDRVVVGGIATLQPGEQVTPQPAPSDLVNYHAEGRHPAVAKGGE